MKTVSDWALPRSRVGNRSETQNEGVIREKESEREGCRGCLIEGLSNTTSLGEKKLQIGTEVTGITLCLGSEINHTESPPAINQPVGL